MFVYYVGPSSTDFLILIFVIVFIIGFIFVFNFHLYLKQSISYIFYLCVRGVCQLACSTCTRWRVARTRLACCRGAHGPLHGIRPSSVTGERVGQDRLREYFVLLRLCGVSPPLSHPAFFASGVSQELQAVLGWSIRSASTHHFPALPHASC